MKISVIMPVFDEKLFELKQSIRSILNQTYKSFEFIIVDDNPYSMSIKHFLLNEASKDYRIKVLFNKKNIGSMKSANRAINYSEGEFIARMDADDIADKNRLKYQLLFCLHNKLDLATCNVRSFTNNHFMHNSSYNITQVSQYKIKYLISHMSTINDVIGGPTLFFKRNIVKNLGGYRNMLGEDCDLVLRMIIHKYRVGYLSIPLVYKRYRLHSLSNKNSLKVFVIMRLLTKYVRKYKFNKILSLSYVKDEINSISQRDYYKYLNFRKYSHLYKTNKNLSYLLKKYIFGCSSMLIFQRNIYMLKYKLIHKMFILHNKD